MHFKYENISQYHAVPLAASEHRVSAELCHEDGLCCAAEYALQPAEGSTGRYLLLANSALVEMDGFYEIYTQVCAVLFCSGAEADSCAVPDGGVGAAEGGDESSEGPESSGMRLWELRGRFATPHVFPSVLRRDLTLDEEWTWADQHPLKVMGFGAPSEDLLVASLYGRWYERDVPIVGPRHLEGIDG